jgi:hypothetical protein
MSVFVLIVVVWFYCFIRSPKLNAILTDVRVAAPDNRWETDIKKNSTQSSFVFKIHNKYNKDIRLFGIYSSKMNYLSYAIRDINFDFPQKIGAGEKKIFTINYLFVDKAITKKNDFKIYSCFNDEILPVSVETTWRGNWFFAPFFGVGYGKVIDVQ